MLRALPEVRWGCPTEHPAWHILSQTAFTVALRSHLWPVPPILGACLNMITRAKMRQPIWTT